MSALHVGTSGFAYADWKPLFYPPEVAQSRFLQHYSSRLPSVEINYTFNRFPTEKLLAGWASKVPEAFTFSLKAPRRISHEKRLRDCADEVARLVEPARTLGARLGPVLVQTPPTLAADAGLLGSFLQALPAGLRVAFEFRHPSWNDASVVAALRAHGAAWVAAEDDDAAAVVHDTGAPFAYARLRRSRYDEESLAPWLRQIREWDERGIDVFCYLRHDDDGSNALAAERLLEKAASTDATRSDQRSMLVPAPKEASMSFQIVDERAERYMRDLLTAHDEPVVLAMEAEAAERGFPIVNRHVGVTLEILARTLGARRVFELGSGYGYSAYWWARVAEEVHCTDGDPANEAKAREYLSKAGVWDRIRFHVGDAVTSLDAIEGEFDVVYCDIDKHGYPDAWRAARSRVRVGGLYVCDNVLWSGRVAEERDASDERAHWTDAIKEHNTLIATDPDFVSSILPIRDGVMVACRVR